MNYNFNNLWVEKYRPKTLDDFIISENNKNIINSFKVKKEIPNLLFTGSPGLGKTTLAKILVNDILKCQYLYINASDENGIDTIRNKVVSFAQTKSFDGSIKVIILDETDGLSIDAQRALRNTMEEFALITRFILTANYRYRIITALQSRCQSIDLTPSSELLSLIVKRCANILKKENIELTENSKAPLIQFVKSTFPDLRKSINELQKFSSTGKLILADQTKNEVYDLVYSEIKNKNIQNLRKALIENEGSFNSDYVNLLKGLFNYIDKVETDLKVKRFMLLTIAEHLYRSSFVVDQEINCYSCLITLTQN